jgi:putative ABC transport system permease protein
MVSGVPEPEAVKVEDLHLAAGSFFSDFAASSRLPVAVAGSSLAGDLGLSGDGSPASAIGRVIDADGVRFTVIGILAAQGGFGPGGNDDALLVPWQAMAGRLVEADPDPGRIQVQAEPGAESWFQSSVTTALRSAHKLGTGDDDDFLVLNAASLIQAVAASGATFTRLITAIAAISLVVGGIGIANVMLVAVRERTREIGVRRAIGARRRDVLAQFLTEATVLSLVGGLIGVAGGLALAWALPGLSGQATKVSYPAAVVAFAVSGLVGMVAGIGPANQAARLDPAAALRYE